MQNQRERQSTADMKAERAAKAEKVAEAKKDERVAARNAKQPEIDRSMTREGLIAAGIINPR